MDGQFAVLVLFIRWGSPGRSVGTLVGDVLVKKVSNMEYSKGEESAERRLCYVRPRTQQAKQALAWPCNRENAKNDHGSGEVVVGEP